MKKLTLLLLLCGFISFGIQAQDINQTWVFIIERDAGQITFNEKEKKITFQQFADIQTKELKERSVQLEILEVVKEKKNRRFIVNDPKTDKIGFIYCFDIGKESMRMYLEQRAKSVEFARSFDVPEDSGIKGYTWKKTAEILKLKDPEGMSKAEALQILNTFKSVLKARVGDDVPENRDYDEQMYLKHTYYDLLVDAGYNIFGENKSVTVGIMPYLEDEDVKKIMEEIDRLITGNEQLEESAPVEEH